MFGCGVVFVVVCCLESLRRSDLAHNCPLSMINPCPDDVDAMAVPSVHHRRIRATPTTSQNRGVLSRTRVDLAEDKIDLKIVSEIVIISSSALTVQ